MTLRTLITLYITVLKHHYVFIIHFILSLISKFDSSKIDRLWAKLVHRPQVANVVGIASLTFNCQHLTLLYLSAKFQPILPINFGDYPVNRFEVGGLLSDH